MGNLMALISNVKKATVSKRTLKLIEICEALIVGGAQIPAHTHFTYSGLDDLAEILDGYDMWSQEYLAKWVEANVSRAWNKNHPSVTIDLLLDCAEVGIFVAYKYKA